MLPQREAVITQWNTGRMMMNNGTMCDSTVMSSNYHNMSSTNYHGMFAGFNPYNPVISSTGVFPAVTDFAGDTNFQIILRENDSSIKKKWLFSEKLRKVFIDIDKSIGIQFQWQDVKLETPSPRFVRALPVYTQDDWLRIPVERCPMHRCYEDQTNIDFPWVNHVLRCENEGTQYEIDHESGRRSCITPVTLKDSVEPATLFYKFVCKTSCYRGMQRRPVVVIFTLEDFLGNVLGRRCLSFKVCSCLKRDLHREENGLRKRKNRKLISTPTPNYDSLPPIMNSTHLSSSSSLSSMMNIASGPCCMQLLRLKRENAISAMEIMHNTLLGEFVRNNFPGTDGLLAQFERLLNQLYRGGRSRRNELQS